MMTIEDLSAGDFQELLDRTFQPTGKAKDRRDEFRHRWLIHTEHFEPLLEARMREVYETGDIYAQVSKWALPLFNPQKRASSKIAVTYKKRPQRYIDGVKRQKNLERLYTEIGFNQLAKSWDRKSIEMNTVIVVPMPKRTELGELTFDFDVVTGAVAEVHPNPDVPWWDAPGVLAHRLMRPMGMDGTVRRDAPAVRMLDARWITYWTDRGDLIPSMTIEHGLGMFPAAPMRSTVPDEDWWDPDHARGMTHTVTEVGSVAASMNWTRKTQCRFLIALLSQGENPTADGTPDNQTMGDPEAMLLLKGEGIQLAVHTLDQSVKNFMEQIRELQNEAFELLTGAPSSLADPDPSNPAEGRTAVLQHAAIEERREDQIVARERFEKRMAMLLAKYGQNIRMEIAPEPDAVMDSFRVELQSIPFLDTPAERTKIWIDRTKYGVMSPVDAAIELTGLPREEAKEWVKQKLEERREFFSPLSQDNMPRDPTQEPDAALPGEVLPERQGRAGGRESGVTRRQQSENADA